MFRKIDYGTEIIYEPVKVVTIKRRNKKYHEWDVIIGKSMLNKEKQSDSENSDRTILELMKGINKSIN